MTNHHYSRRINEWQEEHNNTHNNSIKREPIRMTTVSSRADSHEPPRAYYSLQDLIQVLSQESTASAHFVDPELERRVLDFRLAQQKRRQKYGDSQVTGGIFGLYHHLAQTRMDLEWAQDAAWRRQHQAPYLAWSDYVEARPQVVRSYFTWALIAVCAIMMVVEFGLNDWNVEPLSVNPLIGPSAEALVRAGARETSKIVVEGQWFRLFTPLVLHAGLIHYAVNMAALWFIGGAFEESHGALYTVLLFLIPGVGGNVLSAIFLPQYVSVGASGGIFGLIGGCVADITMNWPLLFITTEQNDETSKWQHVRALIWLVVDIVVNALIGFTVRGSGRPDPCDVA
jgi:membrane associated rhomboid family serine protease